MAEDKLAIEAVDRQFRITVCLSPLYDTRAAKDTTKIIRPLLKFIYQNPNYSWSWRIFNPSTNLKKT
nr:hypothetical protein Iba_chr04dCG2370 [Ipomoea batatas]